MSRSQHLLRLRAVVTLDISALMQNSVLPQLVHSTKRAWFITHRDRLASTLFGLHGQCISRTGIILGVPPCLWMFGPRIMNCVSLCGSTTLLLGLSSLHMVTVAMGALWLNCRPVSCPIVIPPVRTLATHHMVWCTTLELSLAIWAHELRYGAYGVGTMTPSLSAAGTVRKYYLISTAGAHFGS